MERRHTPRIAESFPVKVRAVDDSGHRFDAETVVDNISAGGVYLRLAEVLREGDELFMMVRMSLSEGDSGIEIGARVAAKGTVRRVDTQPDGKLGLAISFKQHRFV